MTGICHPLHPEHTVLYRVLFHYFDEFLAEYQGRFEKEYGFLRPIVKDILKKYPDPGLSEVEDARQRLAGLTGT